MPNGIVKFFSASKKFGFVSPDDGGKDVFVPFASVTAAGLSALIAGQRLSFEAAPDAKGPKAINLKVIDLRAPPPATKKVLPFNGPGAAVQVKYYFDAASEFAVRTLAELRKGKFELRAVDYTVTPPNVEELKRLSMYLPAGSLVRRYDPLFHDLRLDDRFMGQNEFWNGIVEHPKLINGPILATANRTCICQSDEDVTDFLESIFPGLSRPVTEERALSKHAVTLAPEPAIEVEADVEPELIDAEPVVPRAKRSAKKPSKAAEKKKSIVKARVTKVAKKAARKPAPKRTRPKSK